MIHWTRERKPMIHGRLHRACASLASALFLMACGDNAKPVPVNQCIPTPPRADDGAFAPAASLPGIEPAVLWRTRVTGATTNDWLLLTAERIAFTAGGRLFLLDFAGNYLGGRTSAALERVTSAVADADGNFYFAGHSVYSVDRDGDFRWLSPLPMEPGETVRASGRMVLSPDGGLFFGANDGHLYAFESGDGTLRWRRKVANVDDGETPPAALAGAGSALLAISRSSESRPQLYRADNGEPLAWFGGPGGERYGAMLGRSLGIVTQRMEDKGGAYPWMHISVLGWCGEERWSLPATRPQWPALIGPGDRLFVVERDDEEGSPTSVSVYEPDGTRAAGPVDMPPPWAIGADGTIYALACDSPGYEGPSRLYAYSADLEEQWMLPLGDACPMAGPVIDAEGRLYFTWYMGDATEVVAVQTASPGIANTSWPVRRRDTRGTAWLD